VLDPALTLKKSLPMNLDFSPCFADNVAEESVLCRASSLQTLSSRQRDLSPAAAL